MSSFHRRANFDLTDSCQFPYPLSEWDSQYASQEHAWFESERGYFLPDRCWKFSDVCIAIPEELLLKTFL
jgi:hypothetical protein